MSAGKLAAQAGHAFTDALHTAPAIDRATYMADPPGTKIVLRVRDKATLHDIAARCAQAGINHRIVIDSGHVMPPHFDGKPIVTALGIGPVARDAARPILGKLQLVR